MGSLFTYIFEFRGGTYTTQVLSNNLIESIKDWITEITEQHKEIDHLGLKTIEEIKVQLLSNEANEEPVLLKGIKNVWYLTVSTKQGFGTLHIVKTVEK